jgi:hypothetical protein
VVIGRIEQIVEDLLIGDPDRADDLLRVDLDVPALCQQGRRDQGDGAHWVLLFRR